MAMNMIMAMDYDAANNSSNRNMVSTIAIATLITIGVTAANLVPEEQHC